MRVPSGQTGGGAAGCSVLPVVPQGRGVCHGERGVLQRGAGARCPAQTGQYLLQTGLLLLGRPRRTATLLLNGCVTEVRHAGCGVDSAPSAVYLGCICRFCLAALTFSKLAFLLFCFQLKFCCITCILEAISSPRSVSFITEALKVTENELYVCFLLLGVELFKQPVCPGKHACHERRRGSRRDGSSTEPFLHRFQVICVFSSSLLTFL